jgi:cAMP-specific phosphodiesterase 4
MVGMILATDMARHATDLGSFKTLLEQKKIKNGENVELIVDHSSSAKEFDSKQQLIEICLHAADVSSQCRPFEVAKEWSYLLFEEFFWQGDLEKEQNLPVSFLCDRTNTNIAKSQPGFVDFIVLPLFNTICEILPENKPLVKQARENAERWKTYEESDNEKLVYTKIKPADAFKHLSKVELEDSEEREEHKE